MQRIIAAYVALVAIAVAWYGWATSHWLGWIALGYDVFSDSPDAGYNFDRSLETHLWSGGLLVGLAIGACALVQACRQSGNTSRRTQILAVIAVITPMLALAVGQVMYSRVQNAVGKVSDARPNKSLERSRDR